MKVLLIGNYPGDRQQSMQRFAALMQEGLTEAGHQVRLLRPPVFAGRLGCGAAGARRWLGYLDKLLLFPPYLLASRGWADVAHICDHSNAMYTRCLGRRAHLVTCHDVLALRSARGEFAGHRVRWTGRLLQRMILGGLLRARHVACVSEPTREDLVRISGLPSECVSVIWNGQNYRFSPMPPEQAAVHLSRLGIADVRPFLFHIGGNYWYKNRLGVLRIFSALVSAPLVSAPVEACPGRELKLVMAGEPWTREMRRFVAERGLEGKVFSLAEVSSEELRALYSSAAALLFPSLEEGFGWPIVEAQACGCPVFTSNRAPMTQVGGDAAIYFDPEDAGAAARVIARKLDSLAKLRAPSLENAARFSAAEMIRGYEKLYGALLDEDTARH